MLNQTPLDWAGNQRNILAAIEAARAAGRRVLCLPELCITGYGCEDAFHGPGLQQTAWTVLREILPATRGMVVSLGLPLLHRNALFNCACLAVDGRIAGFVAKRFLAGDGLHYEPRWFKPWPQGVRDTVELGRRRNIPIGDLVFDCGGVKIGFEICEDAWVGQRPGGDMSPAGVDVILNPSASHFAFGKHEVRKRLVIEGSRAFNVSYVYANLLGNEAGRVIYDGGALIASGGQLLAAGPRFSFAALARDQRRDRRGRHAHEPGPAGQLSARPGQRQTRCEVACAFAWPDIEPEVPPPQSRGVGIGPARQGRGVHPGGGVGAVRLPAQEPLAGIRGQPQRRGRFLGRRLPGGADGRTGPRASWATRRFRGRWRYIPGLAEAQTTREQRCARLLHCVYQATRNSSQATRAGRHGVAEALGGRSVLPGDRRLVEGYVSGIERALGRKLTWETDDIALQNIQARVRGAERLALANVKNALLLATSNRSEAAVGYATMDGDTCGGLSPIAGIDKAFLLRWLAWLETRGARRACTRSRAGRRQRSRPPPSCGRRVACQTDEDDLMPYAVLDAIERAAIRDKQPPRGGLPLVRAAVPAVRRRSSCTLWVERFFRLWCRNQWKRERYAPSFHLDDENLDPKTWCRFPDPLRRLRTGTAGVGPVRGKTGIAW